MYLGNVALVPPDPPLSDGAVVLRPLDERDLPALDRSSFDPEIQRWFGAATRTAAELLERKRQGWAEGTAASFAICNAVEPEICLGQVFIELEGEGRGRVGYWLLAEARGRGLATRAVRVLAGWALNELRLARLELWTEPENAPSQRVAERSGFQREGVLRSYVERRDGTRADAVFYSLLPSDIAASEREDAGYEGGTSSVRSSWLPSGSGAS